jgi:hypothetical protein
VILKALATDGVIRWYDESYGGALLDTGSVFLTDTLFSSVTYYAEASNAGCTSFRNSVTASIIAIPFIVSTLPQSRVGPGSVILTAYPSAGSVEWYDDSLTGNHLFSGTSFLTPFLSQTTTFYAEALYKCCASNPRTAVTATIPNGINDPYDQYKVTIYPNPCYDKVLISPYSNDVISKIMVYNYKGELICEIGNIKSSQFEYNTAELPAGLYFIKVLTKNVKYNSRFIKE